MVNSIGNLGGENWRYFMTGNQSNSREKNKNYSQITEVFSLRIVRVTKPFTSLFAHPSLNWVVQMVHNCLVVDSIPTGDI